MRYKRLTGNIYRDYELYAGRCGFFNTFYGDKLTPALQANARYMRYAAPGVNLNYQFRGERYEKIYSANSI